MQSWSCCRACMKVNSLHSIYQMSEHSEKYTEIVYLTTGIKISPNDNLPLEMCTTCINFINESVKFRRKCEQVQKQLLENKPDGIKLENCAKDDPPISIDITDLLDSDFKDFDDNITLDTLQINENNIKTINNSPEQSNNVECLDKVVEITEKTTDSLNGRKKRVKMKERDKKDERKREEIECEFCHKILTSKLSLRNHYKIHTGFDVICEHCGKKFITRRLLLMHCRAKHGYEKTDKCSYCDYRASNAEQVKIHERLHTGEKPFVCAQCGAGFHRRSSHLQHVAIHLPDKNFQCDQCPARFKSATLMRIHRNRHRPSPYSFKCGVCGNSFARRRNVARHLQRVHGLPPDDIHRVRVH